MNKDEKEMTKELQSLIDIGLIKIIYKNGQTLYQLTEEGKKIAEEMIQIDPKFN